MSIHFKILIILTACSSLSRADGYKDYISKGDSLYNQFYFEDAITQYEKAYKLTPDDYYIILRLTRTYNDLGEEYYEQRNKKKAETAVYKALQFAQEFKRIFPDSARVYSYLAWSYGNVALYKGGNEKVKLAYEIKNNAEESID